MLFHRNLKFVTAYRMFDAKKLLKMLKVKFEFVDAKERSFYALKGITDPEEKRKICLFPY